MAHSEPNALTVNGRDPAHLRGDSIDGERYFSTEFAEKEAKSLWQRIWPLRS